jgi:hypothetical protein
MQQVDVKEEWACYDKRVEALLGMGAAGVVESLHRVVSCIPGVRGLVEHPALLRQIHGSRAAKLGNKQALFEKDIQDS